MEDYNNYDNEDYYDEDACLMVNKILNGNNNNNNNSKIMITIDSGASRFYVKDIKLLDKLNINANKKHS